VLQVVPHVSRLPFLPIRVRGIFSYLLAMKWIISIPMYHQLSNSGFRIETFFSDQKSRGFHIHKSHISDPQRLSRLLIAACLAYLWIVYLGSLCEKEGWGSIIHRRDRCDLSLFQLGLRLLEHVINENLPIIVQFYVII
jgi:hypothetical protein